MLINDLHTHLLISSRRDLSPAYKFNLTDGLDADGDLNPEEMQNMLMELTGHDVSCGNNDKPFETSLRRYNTGNSLSCSHAYSLLIKLIYLYTTNRF